MLPHSPLAFNVAAINDAPERVGAQLTLGGVQEDNTFSITAAQLLAGYTDADGDTLSVSALTLSDTNKAPSLVMPPVAGPLLQPLTSTALLS